ncbi:MAG: M1 family metallopeptidase [Ferruginibacter sp.]
MKKILLLLVISKTMTAQVKLPVPRDVQKLYDKATRSADGRPGKNYWQNTADYTIHIKYDPATRVIQGSEEITYFNNSPDALFELVFKLYPNIYKKGGQRDMDVEDIDLTDGVNIEGFKINGIEKKKSQVNISGTNMTVSAVDIDAGQSVKLSIQFSYTLNKRSHIRTGEIEQNAAFIAYFFPRIAVYDDLDGWNKNQYIGSQEFYNDFCNFDVAITVPDNFLVWATGDLQNCGEVMTSKYCSRLSAAEKKDDVVFIVDENDLKAGGITVDSAFNTWKFNARNVVDFAFAVSDHYVWNASSLVVDKATGRRTRVDALFNTKHKDYFDVIQDARKTVELMSYNFPKWPFPYNHISIFDGLDQMEYPMMVNDNPVDTRESSITLTDHEVFHTMFPFYMGTNETKYGFMDEGWATMGEWLLSNLIDSTLFDDYGMDRTEKYAGTEIDVPITTLSTQQNGVAFFINSYPKPALGYLYAKDMLGDDLFFKGLHFYIKQWNGKHPLPLDFFNCMNTGSGKNLNWFWKKWFYDNGYPDLAISKVVNTGTAKQIIIESKGNKPVPVDVTIAFADGSMQKIHRSIAVWEKGNSKVTLNVTSTKKVAKVELGSTYVADVNKNDNTWEVK